MNKSRLQEMLRFPRIRGPAGPVALVTLGVLAANAPFLDQAFHMDDAIYLKIARHVLVDPWHPQDFPVLFEGRRLPDLGSMEHPPLVPYLLAAAARVAGSFDERPLHAAHLVFPLMAVLAMHALARRFTRAPLAATLLLAALPAFAIMSHCLMSDMAHLALGTAAAASAVAAVDRRSPALLLVAAAFLLLAALASYAALALVPILALYALLHGARRAAAMVAIAPAAAFLVWLGFQQLHYGRFTPAHLLDTYVRGARVLSPEMLGPKAVYALGALGGTLLVPLALVTPSRRRFPPMLVCAAAAACLLGASRARGYAGPEQAIFFGSVLAGLLVVWRVAESAWRGRAQRDALFLAAWFAGALALAIGLYITGSARYLLPAMPPMVLVLVESARAALDPGRFRALVAGTLLLAGSGAALLSAADYQMAGMYRDFARDLAPALRTMDGKLWFTGEWGLRAYLERAGAEELGRRDGRARPGDWIAVPKLPTTHPTLYEPELSIRSLVLRAPAELSYDVGELPAGSSLKLIAGLPLWRSSDGVDLAVSFASGAGSRTLSRIKVGRDSGRRWRDVDIPIEDPGPGRLVLAATPEASGRSGADWLALARARIRAPRPDGGDEVRLDLLEELASARVSAAPGAVSGGAPGGHPVIVQDVRLEQEPATALVGRYAYAPRLPIRLLDERAHAGFWNMGWGLLPFSIARAGEPLDMITVRRVLRRVDDHGETEPAAHPGDSRRQGIGTGDRRGDRP